MRIIQIKRIVTITICCLLLMMFSQRLYAQSYSKPELYIKTGHIAPVYAVAVSPDNKLLASGGSDGNIKLWNIETGQEIRTLASQPTFISSLAFSPDGKTLACLGGGFLTLWNVSSGKGVVPLSNGVLVFDELLRRQNDPAQVRKLLSARIEAASVAFNPKKKNIIAIGGADNIILWDFFAGKKIRSLPIQSQPNHSTEIEALAFSPDGKVLVSGGTHTLRPNEINVQESNEVKEDAVKEDASQKIESYGDLRLWNPETGREITTLSGRARQIVSSVNWIAVSPDGKTLAVVDDGMLRRWNIVTGRALNPFTATEKAGERIYLKSIVFSPDGKIILAGTDSGEVKVWDAITGKELPPLSGHKSWIVSIAFSPNGKVFATGSQDGMIKLWNGNTREENKSLSKRSGFHPCEFSPADVKLVCVSDKTILLWNLASGREFQLLKGHSGNITSIAFTPDGKILASGGDDKTVKLWDTTTGQQIEQFDENTGYITALAFSRDGETLAAGSNASDSVFDKASNVTLWKVKNKQVLWSIKTDPGSGQSSSIKSIAFSSDKRKLAVSNYGVVKLLDVKTGEELKSLKAIPNTSYPIEFSPDGKTLLAGALDFRIIKQWDVASETEMPLPKEIPLWLKQKFVRRVNGLNISIRQPLIEISDNTKIQLQDADTKREIVSLAVLNETDWLAVTPDGLFDGTPDAWKQVIWRFNKLTFDYAPIEAFFNEFFRPGLLKEITDGSPPAAPLNIASLDRRQPQVTISAARAAGAANNERDKLSVSRIQTIRVEVKEAPAESASNAKNNVKRQPSGEIRDVRLFRNGLLVKVWRGESIAELVKSGCEKSKSAADGARRIVCQAQAAIAEGDNQFTAYAFNRDNVKSIDAEMNIKGATSLKREGTLYILAIGINEYADAARNLKYALADVDSIGENLHAQQTNLRHYAETRVIKLTDKTATRENILLALSRFSDTKKLPLPANLPTEIKEQLAKIELAQPEDGLLIYFSGHGTARCLFDKKLLKTDCDRFYLIPHDGFPTEEFKSEKERLDRLYQLSISDWDLEKALETLDAGKLMMIIDACNSGQALEAEEKRRGPMNSRGLAQLAYEKGMYILAASQSRSAAWEASKLGHGLLTFSLLEGLTKADKDDNKEVVEREWFDFAVQQVPQMQLEVMKLRNEENKGLPEVQKKSEIVYLDGSDANLPPEKRGLQTPRIFYRRELELKPFVVSKAANQ